MGLITSSCADPSRASVAADRSNQRGSSVSTSSKTLLSTRMSATLLPASAPRQRQDLVGAHAGRGPAPHGFDQPVAPITIRRHLLQDDHSTAHREGHLGVGSEAGLPPNRHWNRDLALARDTHAPLQGKTLTGKSNTYDPCLARASGPHQGASSGYGSHRRSGSRAALVWSRRRTGVVTGASRTTWGEVSVSWAMRSIASQNASSVSFASVSVGSIMSASSTMSGK